MHLSELEMADPELSVQELKKQLFTSLKCTGILDSLKSQLRARLLDHLRDQDGTLLGNKDKDRRPSVTERLLSSLFLDYLNSYGYAFTQSVFLPESRMVSWPPFTYKEILHLLHLDSAANSNLRVEIAPERGGCLMQHLVKVLQDHSFRSTAQDVSIQTHDLGSCLREIDDACSKKQEAERLLAFRSLEARLTEFREEFETRVNGEVAIQVNRVREYETNALRMEEACRYRRQLGRDREELEELHKARLERIHEREESLMDRLRVREKAIETSAYEQRQRLLADITSLRDREEKLKEREDLQTRREEKIDEHMKFLQLKEEDICHMRETLYARVDESAELRIKELEDQYRSRNEQLQVDRANLEAKWVTLDEEKERLAKDLIAAKQDEELVISLQGRLAAESEQRRRLLSKIENICQQQQQKWNHEETKMRKTIIKLETKLKDMLEDKEGLLRNRKALQVQLRHSESELLDTVTLLKKTQHALELERLHHYSLRSQIAPYRSWSSLQAQQEEVGHMKSEGVNLDQSFMLNSGEPRFGGRNSKAISSSDKEPEYSSSKSLAEMVSHHLNPSPKTNETKFRLVTSPPSSSKKSFSPDCTREHRRTSETVEKGTGVDQVRVYHDRRQKIDGIRAVDLYSQDGDKGESGGKDMCPTASRKQNNPFEDQRCGNTTQAYTKGCDKSGSHSATSEASCPKRVGRAQISPLPTNNTRKPHCTKQSTLSTGTKEAHQSGTNYMMGTASLKSSASAVVLKVVGKAVKHSTVVDSDYYGRRHTKVCERKMQKKFRVRAEAQRAPKRWPEVTPEFGEQSAFLLIESQKCDLKGKRTYESEPYENTCSKESSRSGEKDISARRFDSDKQPELPLVISSEIQRPREHNQALEPSLPCIEHDLSKGHPSDEQHNLSTVHDVGRGPIHERMVPDLEHSGTFVVSHAQPPENVEMEVNAYGLSAMVLEDLKRFSQQLEMSRTEKGVRKPSHMESSGLLTENEIRQARPKKDEEWQVITSKEIPDGEDMLESVNQKHESTTPTSQSEDVLERQPTYNGHSTNSPDFTSVKIAGTKTMKRSDNAEGANSEESCSNPIMRAPTVRNTPEASAPREGTLQERADNSVLDTQQWDVQSEQGSHSPAQETFEWVDDYATGEIDQYVDYSDAFSVPESNNTPSTGIAIAGPS